jgi:alkanesulfonate monooxygenase SsuD/methylene tetrahydromethanopterin reductase-like flavin-dependent oxidoreductase (luciferase family)
MDPLWNDLERAAVESRLREAIVGSEHAVKSELEKLLASTGADEVIAVTDTWDHDARLESYRRFAHVASGIDMNTLARGPLTTSSSR